LFFFFIESFFLLSWQLLLIIRSLSILLPCSYLRMLHYRLLLLVKRIFVLTTKVSLNSRFSHWLNCSFFTCWVILGISIIIIRYSVLICKSLWFFLILRGLSLLILLNWLVLLLYRPFLLKSYRFRRLRIFLRIHLLLMLLLLLFEHHLLHSILLLLLLLNSLITIMKEIIRSYHLS